MVDAAQKARPHQIDDRDVEVKRAMPREVSRIEDSLGPTRGADGVSPDTLAGFKG